MLAQQVGRPSRHAVARLFDNSRCFVLLVRVPRRPRPQSLQLLQQQAAGIWQLEKSSCSRRAIGTSATHLRRYLISEGRTTTVSADSSTTASSSPSRPSYPFYLETGYSVFAKRPSRPFPPPFVSLPSGSFSDPLTTHNPSSVSRGARRPTVNGELVRGITNGDDAIIISAARNFVAVNDGVGAWAQKERGHAALWSRLIAHFWDVEVEKSLAGPDGKDAVKLGDVDPVQNLQDAYDATKKVTKGTLNRDREDEFYSEPEEGDRERADNEDASSSSPSTFQESKDNKDSTKNDILGTTTAASALLYYKPPSPPHTEPTPVIFATTLGDCKILLIRPSHFPPSSSSSSSPETENDDGAGARGRVLYHSKEQWHWFDCPRQLGTNSPDTPLQNAVCDIIDNVEVGDVVAVLSDGVTDNLWEHEICENICESMSRWNNHGSGEGGQSPTSHREEQELEEAKKDGVIYVARRLMNAAREIAMDPNAESPYMERAFDEGIAAEGGKLDDISVVIGVVRKTEA
ncbi:uncharacterized protein Z519_01910 [Cladophialophora bantiana CBS 173.52]|uniref:Protein phosphatase n=1 Tax=Cladophialophora bantiana (strain ATCC 10958 / CBS 173.52 / CDC B-1940 / NIH 8579) TaxID=1442370 RepID=A0A0D2F8C1_CLAB1|nr:uncharacterized protein Z519_01910 [Cladophialophora bantiana CBS 173.52]KIW98326.1 hypothetical protein Z519_01910 [Cladophialophora bantiana CBS 173.52]